MGELENQIFVIGSPDIDIMFSDQLPQISQALNYYDIPFKSYNILMFHPVTSEENIGEYAQQLVQAVLEDDGNYIVIKPNNDKGSSLVNKALKKLENHSRFISFPSLRFEYFLVLLKHCQFIIGNSSAGVREAPHYGVASIDIGSRQLNRVKAPSIIHSSYEKSEIKSAISQAKLSTNNSFPTNMFGKGNSDVLFLNLLKRSELWQIPCQKQFKDRALKG
jgi:UDP-N-acetylglucosamine 2-epimerase (hydrolysing)